MPLPLNWMVFLFFLFIVAILFIIFTLNSKFKWRMIANDLEQQVVKLNKKISHTPDIKTDFTEAIAEIKEKLSERQFEIFLYAIEGLGSKGIADKINLSPNTIDSNIKEICKILKVKKRSQLVSVFFDKLNEKIGIESLSDI